VQLDKIYRTVSSLTQSMDEIVWAVNPKNDNLENFAYYLVEFAQGFLTDADIRCRVQLPETLPPCLLPAQFRHHLFLSCKEALNNVAKHARATEVTVQLRAEAGQLVVALADNGHGLAAAETAGSAARPGEKDGLTNMRARLAVLGGSCEIASSVTGTTVTFTAPLPASPSA
jgi:signal transduction histidine kinase